MFALIFLFITCSRLIDTLFICYFAIGFSLLRFMKHIFQSKDSTIVGRVHRFYADDGPSFLIDHWRKTFPAHSKNNHYGRPITVAATYMVLDRAKEDLIELARRPDLRMPAKGLTGAEIRAFSLDTIGYQLETYAPILNRLLHGLTGFQINEDAPSSAKLSDKHEPEFVATLASMPLHNQSQTSNYLQRMMGLTLHTSGCAERIVNILNSAHLSVSYGSTQSSLDNLSDDAEREMQEEVLKRPFNVNYDNLNVFQRVGDQTLGNSDKQTNGITAKLF